jgi:N-methylhydantoinase A/oxoprolinase/acetone carboxylase beta subunit
VPGEPGFRVCKLLSVDPSNYDDAPREGIRRILEEVRIHDSRAKESVECVRVCVCVVECN